MSYQYGQQSAREQRAAAIRELETRHRSLTCEVRELLAAKAAAEDEARAAQHAARLAKQDADMTIRRHTLRVHHALSQDTKEAAELVRIQALKDFPEPETIGAKRLKAAQADMDRHNRECPRCIKHTRNATASRGNPRLKAAS